VVQIPTIPNSNAPLAQPETGLITQSWQRQFALLFAAANISGMMQIYVGTDAPQGWTEDTTVGLPVLPVGMIWIRKD